MKLVAALKVELVRRLRAAQAPQRRAVRLPERKEMFAAPWPADAPTAADFGAAITVVQSAPLQVTAKALHWVRLPTSMGAVAAAARGRAATDRPAGARHALCGVARLRGGLTICYRCSSTNTACTARTRRVQFVTGPYSACCTRAAGITRATRTSARCSRAHGALSAGCACPTGATGRSATPEGAAPGALRLPVAQRDQEGACVETLNHSGYCLVRRTHSKRPDCCRLSRSRPDSNCPATATPLTVHYWSSVDVETSIQRGIARGSELQGWISRGYRHVEPCPTLVLKGRASRAALVLALPLDGRGTPQIGGGGLDWRVHCVPLQTSALELRPDDPMA